VVTGIYGQGANISSGSSYGGRFDAPLGGTGPHFGVTGYAVSASSGLSIGSRGDGVNSSSGDAYGGVFTASGSGGTGTHVAVDAGAIGNTSAPTYGVRSSADNNSSGSVYAGRFEATSSGDGAKYGIYAKAAPVQGYAGYFEGDVRITDSLIVLGGKSAAVKVDNGEYRLLYSQESPEVWFEDVGSGQLINGKAHIQLDPLFLQTVTIDTKNRMRVFIQLEADCNGTYVTPLTNGFDVTELKAGKSNASFSYRVMAKRKGFENFRLSKMNGLTPEKVEAEQLQQNLQFQQQRQIMDEAREKMQPQRTKIEIRRENQEGER
jgi:hypothetical protein